MKRRYNITVTILVIAVFLINSTVCAASGESSALGNLYALSAVLMDALSSVLSDFPMPAAPHYIP